MTDIELLTPRGNTRLWIWPYAPPATEAGTSQGTSQVRATLTAQAPVFLAGTSMGVAKVRGPSTRTVAPPGRSRGTAQVSGSVNVIPILDNLFGACPGTSLVTGQLTVIRTNSLTGRTHGRNLVGGIVGVVPGIPPLTGRTHGRSMAYGNNAALLVVGTSSGHSTVTGLLATAGQAVSSGQSLVSGQLLASSVYTSFVINSNSTTEAWLKLIVNMPGVIVGSSQPRARLRTYTVVKSHTYGTTKVRGSLHVVAGVRPAGRSAGRTQVRGHLSVTRRLVTRAQANGHTSAKLTAFAGASFRGRSKAGATARALVTVGNPPFMGWGSPA